MGGVISAPGAIRFQMPRFWRHKQNCGNSWFWRRRRKILGFLARFLMIFSHFLTYFRSKSANFVLFLIQGSISGARTTLEYTMGFLRSQDLFLGPEGPGTDDLQSAETLDPHNSCCSRTHFCSNPEVVQSLCVPYRSGLCIG